MLSNIKKITLGILIFLIGITISRNNYVLAEEVEEENNIVNIYLFYSDTCPHCAKEKIFLDDIIKNNDKGERIPLTIEDYDREKGTEKTAEKNCNERYSRICRMVYTAVCTCFGRCFCVVHKESEEFLLDDRYFFSIHTEGFLLYYMDEGDAAPASERGAGISDV